MEEVLASLPLSDEIKGALLRQEGRLGTILKCVIAYERGNWPETRCLDVSPEAIINAYLQSIDWATAVGTVLES
jgi:EAL and modified HD-GYP domain-containing signal transduction protein